MGGLKVKKTQYTFEVRCERCGAEQTAVDVSDSSSAIKSLKDAGWTSDSNDCDWRCPDCTAKHKKEMAESGNIHDRIQAGVYNNPLPWPDKKDPDRKAKMEAYSKKGCELEAQFKEDVLKDNGLTGHPKADAVYSMAWDDGHSSGLSEVASYVDKYAELVK